jgi:hypothetical protein
MASREQSISVPGRRRFIKGIAIVSGALALLPHRPSPRQNTHRPRLAGQTGAGTSASSDAGAGPPYTRFKPSKRQDGTALLLDIHDEIKAGNLSVAHNKRLRRFDDFFIPEPRWSAPEKTSFAAPACPVNRAQSPTICASGKTMNEIKPENSRQRKFQSVRPMAG